MLHSELTVHVSAGAEERLPRYCDAAGGADRPAGPTHAQYHRLHAPQDSGNLSTRYRYLRRSHGLVH
jgi:hypothetical protein